MLRAAEGKFSELDTLGQASVGVSLQTNVPQVAPELQSLQNEMSQLQMELNQLESQVSQLKAQQESGGSLVSSLQAEIEQSTKTLTDLESETASARNQLTSLDAQKMKLVQEGNELNSKLMTEKGALISDEQQLQQLMSGPNPAQIEQQRLDGLRAQEAALESKKNESLKLLTEVRSERVRMEKILSSLEEERERLDKTEPETVEVPPSMSQMSLASGIKLGMTSPASTTIQSPDSTALTNLTGLAESIKITEDETAEPPEEPEKPVESADPFGASSNDPFAEKEESSKSDPFGGSSNAFGGDSFNKPEGTKNTDGFGSVFESPDDPFKKSEDPFSASDPAKEPDPFEAPDPFGASSDPFGASSDPFGGPLISFSDSFSNLASANDPFGSNNADPFGDSNNDPFGDSGKTDPFDSKPKNDPFGDSGSSSDPWAAFGTSDLSTNQNAAASGDNFDFGSAFQPSQKIITEKKAPARPPPARPPPARPAPPPSDAF